MRIKISKKFTAIAIALASLASIQAAEASFIMMLDDPNDSNAATYIYDSSINDSNGAVGAISFIGNVGNYNVNVSTGLSKPLLENGTFDLSSLNITGNFLGTLIVGITDTDFTGNISGLTASYGGSTANSVKFNFLYDTANTEFGGTSFASGNFTASTSGNVFNKDISTSIDNTQNPYSLSIIAEIDHSSAFQTTSFDAFISPTLATVPEPTPLGLLAIGLVGYFLKRRAKK